MCLVVGDVESQPIGSKGAPESVDDDKVSVKCEMSIGHCGADSGRSGRSGAVVTDSPNLSLKGYI